MPALSVRPVRSPRIGSARTASCDRSIPSPPGPCNDRCRARSGPPRQERSSGFAFSLGGLGRLLPGGQQDHRSQQHDPTHYLHHSFLSSLDDPAPIRARDVCILSSPAPTGSSVQKASSKQPSCTPPQRFQAARCLRGGSCACPPPTSVSPGPGLAVSPPRIADFGWPPRASSGPRSAAPLNSPPLPASIPRWCGGSGSPSHSRTSSLAVISAIRKSS